MKARVVTDSGSGLTAREAKAAGIDYLPLQILVGDRTFLDGVDVTPDLLYEKLSEGLMPQTSLPPMGMVEDLFEDYAKEGVTDIVLITLSSGLSSTNENIQSAAKRHGINCHTTDIWSTLGTQRYYALAAQNLLEQGVEPAEIIRRIEKSAAESAGYLIPEDLNHLAAGGRLTPMAAKLGGLLKIKPILLVGKETEGKVGTYEKVRTMSKAVQKATDTVLSQLKPDENYCLVVLDGGSKDAEIAKTAFAKARPDALLWLDEPMYPVIACHTGTGSVGVQYIPRLEGENLA